MIRSVLFDTETTGLDPLSGDRVIEIAALELINDLPTGKQFHRLIDPKRDIPDEATRVHGFTAAMLQGKPEFSEVAAELVEFLGDGNLVAHNAVFDFGFLDAEFDRLGLALLARERMVCTLVLAKARFPGMPNSLDALCRRFTIDLSERTTHNALLDCRLLAEVYVELTGGRQRGLMLPEQVVAPIIYHEAAAAPRIPRPFLPSAAALEAHAAFLTRLRDPIWSAEQGSSACT